MFPLFTYPPWHLMQYDWLIPCIHLEVMQDSFFPAPGPFSGRGKRESRNRTKMTREVKKRDPRKMVILPSVIYSNYH